MKFVLFVERHTEYKAVPEFLGKCLNSRLRERIGVQTVRHNGWGDLLKDLPKRAEMHLNGPAQSDIVAVIALLDLYLPDPNEREVFEKGREQAVDRLRDWVDRKRFRMFFAIHEVEAWLLSSPDLFPDPIRQKLESRVKCPEDVNFDKPPSKLLEELYRNNRKKGYKKVTDGSALFRRLSPEIVYSRCPHFREMVDEMVALARAVGL